MVSRNKRNPGLTQVTGTSRIETALKAVIEFLQPFAQPEEWTPLDMSTGNFQNYTASNGYSPAASRKDAMGRVWLRGLVKSVTAGTALGVLPAGHRPSFSYLLPTITNSGFGYSKVTTDGLLTSLSGGTTLISLDGISFPTES